MQTGAIFRVGPESSTNCSGFMSCSSVLPGGLPSSLLHLQRQSKELEARVGDGSSHHDFELRASRSTSVCYHLRLLPLRCALAEPMLLLQSELPSSPASCLHSPVAASPESSPARKSDQYLQIQRQTRRCHYGILC